MVKNASRALKTCVHLAFDPNFDVGIGAFYPEKFRKAYYVSGRRNYPRKKWLPGESALLTVMLALVVSVPSSFLAMQV